jgi:CheY-like chemotaxis protein
VAEHLQVAEMSAKPFASSPKPALLAARICPCLILLDVNTPVMNGIEFLKAYQQLALA